MSEFRVRMTADTTELEETEAAWRLRLRKLNLDVQRTRLEIRRTELYMVTVMGSVMSMLRVVANLLPAPLRMIGQAAVGAVNAVARALYSTAIALSSASAANPLLLFQATMAWVGVGIAVIGVMSAAAMQEQLDADVMRFQSMMNQFQGSLRGIITSLGV